MLSIWIINEYAGSPAHGMEYRHYCLGRELVRQGHQVSVISASYSHLFYRLPDSPEETLDGVHYKWLRVPRYAGSRHKKRILKWMIFSCKAFFLPLAGLARPDIIIVSPMAQFPVLPAYFLAKLYRARLVYEVKDIWPLTLIELGGYSPRHPAILAMSWLERFALRSSDRIVSNLPNYQEYLRDIGIQRKCSWVPNGVDPDRDGEQREPLDPEIEQQLPRDRFIVGYAGSIGLANALDSFLQARELLARDKVLFAVVGEGQEKDRLRSRYSGPGIVFLPSIPKAQIQSLLQRFDVCYIGLQKKRIFRYGVSANKLFDYMLSARPVLQAIDTRQDLVQQAGCGITVPAEDPQSIASALQRFCSMSEQELAEMGQKGRGYVLRHFTYSQLAKKLEAAL